MGLRKLETISTKRQFFVGLLLAQFVLLPFASRNFDLRDIGRIVSVTLSNAPQVHLGGFNSLFQSLSLLMFILLFVSKDRMKSLFNAYVAVSYLAFAFIQNIALTEQYGFSVVTVNLVMFLLVAYVWIAEVFTPKNSFDFSNFRWKYVWMMILSFFNPHTVYIGFAHLPLLIISLYCTVMSYRITTI
jgi:hypothetical protein